MVKLEGYKYITYLIGSMEKTAEGDDGGSKREKLMKELPIRKVYPINPVQLEKYKIDVNAEKAKEQMAKWLQNKQVSEFKDFSRLIWKGKYLIDKKYGLIHIPGDIDYVQMSDWITCVFNKGDKPCVEESTQVLLGDLTTKAIKDLEVGDKIKGFKKIKGKTVLVTSTVLGVYYRGKKRTLSVYDKNNNHIVVTPEHKFLTPNKKQGSVYKPIQDIEETFSIPFKFQSYFYLKGWITGYLQNDGCFVENKRKHEVTALSDKKEEINKVYDLLVSLGLHPHIRRQVRRDSRIYYIVVISTIKEYYQLKNWTMNHDNTEDFKRGWLAGAVDADGYYEKESIRYTQSIIHQKNINYVECYLTQLGIIYSKNIRKLRKITIQGRQVNAHKEVVICFPKKYFAYLPSQLEYKLKKFNFTINTLRNHVTQARYTKQRVWDIATSTGNFIANGFIIHNCGTYGEAFMSFEHDVPVYLITDVSEEEQSKLIPKSFLQAVYGSEGYIFRDVGAYLNFIENKYKVFVEK